MAFTREHIRDELGQGTVDAMAPMFDYLELPRTNVTRVKDIVRIVVERLEKTVGLNEQNVSLLTDFAREGSVKEFALRMQDLRLMKINPQPDHNIYAALERAHKSFHSMLIASGVSTREVTSRFSGELAELEEISQSLRQRFWANLGARPGDFIFGN